MYPEELRKKYERMKNDERRRLNEWNTKKHIIINLNEMQTIDVVAWNRWMDGRTEWSGGQLALLGSSYSGSLYATGIAMSYTRSDRGTPQSIDGVFAVCA